MIFWDRFLPDVVPGKIYRKFTNYELVTAITGKGYKQPQVLDILTGAVQKISGLKTTLEKLTVAFSLFLVYNGLSGKRCEKVVNLSAPDPDPAMKGGGCLERAP